jgi:tetratricopeptide (TPR) repeat protein
MREKSQESQSDTDALAILGKRAASYPKSIEDVHALADAYADRGRWRDAIKAYEAAIALDATNADLHNSLGTVYEEVGDLEEAERAYQQAIVLSPDDPMAYYNLGLLYEEQQRTSEAIQVLEKCVQYSTDPEDRSEVQKKLSSLLPERKEVVQMYNSIRSWALTSLVLGGLSLFAGGTLDPVWGIVLIVSAILSWRIKIPAMFVLYSVLMAYAAVMNGLSVFAGGSVSWLILALLQAYWAVSILRQFRKYSRLPLLTLYETGTWPANLAPPQPESIITGRFAIAGVILAVTELILLPCVFVGSVALLVITPMSELPWLREWLLNGALDIAVLALGLSCAAALSKNNRKGWAIGGVVGALLAVGVVVVLFVGIPRWFVYDTRTSLKLDLSYPSQVQVGDTFEVVATLHNFEAQALTVIDISIDSSIELNFMNGLELMDTDPPFLNYREQDDTHYYYFDMPMTPGQEQSVILQFKALQAGTFTGIVFVDVIAEDRDVPLHTPPTYIEVVISP